MDQRDKLTIGMATFNDADGVWFTLQALQMYQCLEGCELIVIDNFGCDRTRRACELSGAKYVKWTETTGTAAPRQRLFEVASGDVVLCVDSHVLIAPRAITQLREATLGADMLQGPLLGRGDHWEPIWRDCMYGAWAWSYGAWGNSDGACADNGEHEITMQGLGLFAMRRDAFPGLNSGFRGFGGEEGYLHEKVRRAGGIVRSCPWLSWSHRPFGPTYKPNINDRIRNYIIGWTELGWDVGQVVEHFTAMGFREQCNRILRAAR